MKNKLARICSDFTRQVTKDNINVYAASTAFFIFLSLIPMLLLICSLLPYTPISETVFLSALTDLIPDSMDSFVTNLVNEVYEKSAGKVSAAAVFTLWSAAKGVMALMRGLNAVNEVAERKGFIRLCLRSIFYTLVFLVAIIISLIIMVFGNVIMSYIVKKVPQIKMLFVWLVHFRFLYIWIVLAVIFILMYVFIPNKKQKVFYQIPGAIFASFAWSLFSWGFSLYINNFDGYNMYGSLATIVIILLWLYTCMYIVLIGANMNRYFHPMMKYFYKKRLEKDDFS